VAESDDFWNGRDSLVARCEGLHTGHPRSRCRLSGEHRSQPRTAV